MSSNKKLKQRRLQFAWQPETQGASRSLILVNDAETETEAGDQDSSRKKWIKELEPYFNYESGKKNSEGCTVITMVCKLCSQDDAKSPQDKSTSIADKTKSNFVRHLKVYL